MSEFGRCINVNDSIGATNKVLSDRRRSFVLKLLGQVMKSQVQGNVKEKT